MNISFIGLSEKLFEMLLYLQLIIVTPDYTNWGEIELMTPELLLFNYRPELSYRTLSHRYIEGYYLKA